MAGRWHETHFGHVSEDRLADMKERMKKMRNRQKGQRRKETLDAMKASVTTETIKEEPVPPVEIQPEPSGPGTPKEPQPVPDVQSAIKALAEAGVIQVNPTMAATLGIPPTIAAAQPQSTGGGITMEQLAYFAKLLKEPDEETKAKIAADKKRAAENRKNLIDQAILEEQMKAQRQNNCGHKKENGRTAISGQIHSDGKYHPVCLHCFKEFEPVQPSTEQLQMGVA